jgi:hypothetical protein
MADQLQKLVNAQVITPEPGLEDWVRSMAGYPDRPEGVGEGERSKPEPAIPGEEPALPFAQKRQKGPRHLLRMTNDYQKELFRAYDQWCGYISKQLSEMNGDKSALMAEVDNALPELLDDLKKLGERRIRSAFLMGMRGREPSEKALAAIKGKIDSNGKYIERSLIPAVRERLDRYISDAKDKEIRTYGLAALLTIDALGGLRSRVGMYAGEAWNAVWQGAKILGQEEEEERKSKGEKERRVRWVLDPASKHCPECERYAGEYDRWLDMPTVPGGEVSCLVNCRCQILTEEEDGEWVSVA